VNDDDNKVSLKEHLIALMKERDDRVALALAALSKNRSEIIAMAALLVALLTAAVEYFHR
jgi:hypothetical protein